MPKQFISIFLLGIIFFAANSQSLGQSAGSVCHDAAGAVIPCPARETETPRQTDSDGDGIIDVLDRCPTAGGHAQNAGCPEETTVTEEAPQSAATPLPQANLPSTGACVMASNGTSAVNRRAVPSSQGAIVGVIQPNEIFPVNFALSTSEGTWYNTNPFSWVAASVMRLGGDCSQLPSIGHTGSSLVPDFGAWTAYVCDAAVNPLCGGNPRAGLLTSVQYPYSLAAAEQNPVLIFLFAKPDGGMGLSFSNVLPDTHPEPDDTPPPFLLDFDLLNYDPVIDPPAPTLPKFSIGIDDEPDGGMVIAFPDEESVDPGYEPVFDIANAEADIDILGEIILTNPPMNEGCDLYQATTYFHRAEDIGDTYEEYLGSINGYTLLDGSHITAWADTFGIDYSMESELTITRPYLEQMEFMKSQSGPDHFRELYMHELGNYLMTYDVTVWSWTNTQPNKFRLNICVRYP